MRKLLALLACAATTGFGASAVAASTSSWLAQAPPPPPPPPAMAPTPLKKAPPEATEAESKKKEEKKKEKEEAKAEAATAAPAPAPQPSPPATAEPAAPAPPASAPSQALEGARLPRALPGGEETTEVIVVPPAGEAPPEEPVPPPEAVAETPAEPEQEGPAFIKGNLIYPGTRRLLSRFDHIGVSVGPNIIGTDFYIGVGPGMAWYTDFGLALSLHAPLRLLAVEGGSLDFGGLAIRGEDWDEIADFAKIIRFVTFGRKESNIYFTINTMRPVTVGHGMLINKYQGDIDVDRSMTGIVFDAYNRYGGFELQANDITFSNQIFGGLLFVKPLSLFSDSAYAEGVSIGAEVAADMKAPRCVRFGTAQPGCVQGIGHQAGFNPFTGAALDQTFVRSDPDTGRFDVDETQVQAIGVSAEAKLYKDERNIDIKLYGNWNRFINEGGGDGISGGVLARLNFGDRWINAFRLRGEYRTFGDGFLPNYFDSLYEIQKYAYQYRSREFQVAPTKYQAVFGDPDNGFARTEHGRRHGFNLEGSWGLFHEKRSSKQVAFGFGLQDSTGPADTNLYVHVEAPFFEILQVFATYLRTNVDSISEVITPNALESQNAILLSGIRLQVLPFLFINAHYSRSFRVVASPGSEYHLGNENILDSNGDSSPYFVQDRLFENVQTLFAEVEVGWEFDDD